MLKNNHIPDSEPIIRVGIVLPQDSITDINIIVPVKLSYQIVADSEPLQQLERNDLRFKISGELIDLKNVRKAKSWTIIPREDQEIKPSSGILVKDVISGRGFHWQKKINVYLPGKLEIRIHSHALLIINELPLESYLVCVAISEMGTNCPKALIEAQVITARSWILSNVEQKHRPLNFDVCNDDCCQRYHGSNQLSHDIISTAKETMGKVLLYNNRLCDTRYSKCCGGITEDYSMVWENKKIKYLSSVYDVPANFPVSLSPIQSENDAINWINSTPTCFCSSDIIPDISLKKYLGIVDIPGSYYRWVIKYTQEELTALLNTKTTIKAKSIISLAPLKRGNSGRIIKLKMKYIDRGNRVKELIINSEYEIRNALHEKFLYSSCFYTQNQPEGKNIPDQFIIRGAGWGHGVGMCQIGALAMALQGYTSEEILKHYYQGVELVKIY